MSIYNLDSQAFTSAAADVGRLELAALYTLQDRLARNSNSQGCFKHTLPLSLWNSLMRGTNEINHGPGTFTLNAWRNVSDHLEPNAIQDIIIVCRYMVS